MKIKFNQDEPNDWLAFDDDTDPGLYIDDEGDPVIVAYFDDTKFACEFSYGFPAVYKQRYPNKIRRFRPGESLLITEDEG